MRAASAAAEPGQRAWTSWSAGLVLAVGALALLQLLLRLAGYDTTRAMHAFFDGSIGSPDAFFSGTCVRATPIMLAGLGVAIAFRAGIANIGADGQLLAGAATATAVALGLGGAAGLGGIPVVLVAAALGGALCAGVAALLRRLGVLEVITTLMLNFVAFYVVGFLVRGPLQEPTRIYPQSATVAEAVRLPVLSPGSRLHLGFVLALVLCVVAWAALRFTAAGFRVRVLGDNPDAAATAARIPVARLSLTVFLVSGLLAGLAGGVEVLGVTYALYENLSPGYGFTAIAVALLARLNPLAIIASALALGALGAGAAAMQREAGVPLVLTQVIEAVLILTVVAVSAWERRREVVS